VRKTGKIVNIKKSLSMLRYLNNAQYLSELKGILENLTSPSVGGVGEA
jgi:hypothetical protein